VLTCFPYCQSDESVVLRLQAVRHEDAQDHTNMRCMRTPLVNSALLNEHRISLL
jgi:hypothetical protein